MAKTRVKRSSEADVVTIFDAFEEFITEKEAMNLSKATIRNYRQSFEFFTKFSEYTEESEIEEVTQHNLYKWAKTLQLEGVKHTSINHYIRDVRTFLYWCMDANRKYIEPAYRIKEIKGQEEGLKLFSEDEVAALLEKPKKKESFVIWRTWAICNWILDNGNRASTICNVKLTDINLNKREIYLSHTKNKKTQTIPMSNSLYTVLKEYIRIWRKEAPIDGYLFSNNGEEQLTTNALRLSFGRYCEKRGIEKSNIHGLRHSFAKAWIKNNGNIFMLQKMLGHRSIEMTRRYVTLFSDDLQSEHHVNSPLEHIKKKMTRTQKVKREDY